MRADGEALKVIGGTMHADDDVDRLRRGLGVNAQLHVNVLAAIERIARTAAAVADDDLADAYRRRRTLAFRLALAGRPLAIALQEKRLVFVYDVERRTVTHDTAVIETEHAAADRADVIQPV